MKQEEANKALEQNFFKEKSKFEILEEKFKKTIFGVLNILLKFEDDSFISEVIGLVNETFQFLNYPFYDPMGYLWKNDLLYGMISSIAAYCQTIVFFNNTQLYIVVFYLQISLILLVVLDIVYVSYTISSKNKAGAVWPMRLLRSVVSFIVTVLFNPMVEFLLAILECSNKDENGNELGYYQNYNIDDMHCWTNTHFTVMVVLSIIFTIIFVVICTVVQTIFYETKTSADAEGAKTNSKCDLVNLFIKLILILIYSFLVWNKELHWIVVPMTTLCGFIVFYAYWSERPFYEERMNTAFLIHTGIFFWSTIVLLLTKVLENAEFDGGVFIFLIGTPIVCFIIVSQKDSRFSLLLTNINKFENGESIFKQIRYFLELVDKKYKDRKSNILLKGYIYLHEEYCTLAECPLKKYLKECETNEKVAVNVNVNGTQTGMDSVNLHNSSPVNATQVGGGTTLLGGTASSSMGHEKSEADIFLFQYAMNMYQNGISKFPSCTSLRINFAFFLMERMNNSKKSLIELKNCEKYDPSFEEQFIIFRFHQNQAGGNDDDNDDDDDEGLDIVSTIAYKNYYNTFKESLTNITEIYTEFWTLLLNHSQKTEDDLTKMNEYGEKINQIIEEIKGNYTEMEKLKYNDEEVLELYADFFQDILNDTTQAEYYRGRLRDVQGDFLQREGDKRETNELQGLPSADEFEYIFLSSEGNAMGTIIKASLGICTLFGYCPTDLIGKNIDFIMPDMYQENHKQVLINKINKFKTQMQNNHGSKGNLKSSYREVFAFGKNKLKHAVPLSIKVTLMFTQDQSELFFASKISNEDLYNDITAKTQSKGIPPIINFNMKICYVLTDVDFIVQFYTPNAINFLGFKSNTSGNVDITKSISDLNNNEERIDQSKMPKTEFFKKRYSEPKTIVWKTLQSEEEEPIFHVESTNENIRLKGLMNYSKKIMFNQHAPKDPFIKGKTLDRNKVNQFLPLKRQRYKEDYFLLSVVEINILNQGVGYVFRFEIIENEENDIDGYDDKNFLPINSSKSSFRNDTQIEFCPTYIPEINKKFDLDTHKLGFIAKKYKTNIINDNESKESAHQLNWHEKLKEFAEEKIKKHNEQFIKSEIPNSSYEETEEEEEEEDNEDESEEESEESFNSNKVDNSNNNNGNANGNNVNGNEVKKEEENNSNTNTNENNNIDSESKITNIDIKTPSDGKSLLNTKVHRRSTIKKDDKNNQEYSNYYHVKCLNVIKFSIYDYKKRKLVDIPIMKRESQVEYRKKEQGPEITVKKSKHRAREAENNDDTNEEDIVQLDAILVKQIEYALRKKELQPDITKLKLTSIITYIALIVIASVLFSILISNITTTKDSIEIMKDLHQLEDNLISGIYYIRELILINNDKYKGYIFEKNYTFTNLTGELYTLYKESYNISQNILTTSLKMTEGRINNFIEGNATMKIIEGNNKTNFTVKTIDLSINIAVAQMITSMYSIVYSKMGDITPTNTDAYLYLTNVFSPILDSLQKNLDSFMREFLSKVKVFKREHIYIIVPVCTVLLISCILIKLMYDKAVERKSSYLAVFFEINDNVCKRALDKCDNYAKVLHPLQGDEEESLDEEEDNIDLVKKKNPPKEEPGSSKKKKGSSKENYRNIGFLFLLLIAFSFILGYFLALILTFQNKLDQMKQYMNFYNVTSFYSHSYITLFDRLREYLFDPIIDATIENNMNITIQDKLSNLYEFQSYEVEAFNLILLPGKFQESYIEMNSGDLCPYAGDLFTNKENNNWLSDGYNCTWLTGNSSDYGINVLVSYYIEQCRTQKYAFEKMIEENCAFNNTINEEHNCTIDPFEIFNTQVMIRTGVIRRFLLRPAYDHLKLLFYNSIVDSWNQTKNIYVLLEVGLIVGLTLFFGAYWIPFENKLDQDVSFFI